MRNGVDAMSDDGPSFPARLLEAERQFHELMPVSDWLSKLFFRSVLWFALFSSVYVIVSGL